MDAYTTYSGSETNAGGVPSIISLVLGVFCIASGALVGFLAALVAVALGVVGVLVALAPRSRGGALSAGSVALGSMGVVAALYKLVV